MKILIASDHAGYKLKESIKEFLIQKGYDVADDGCDSEESVNYPIYAINVAKKVSSKKYDRGILFCGSGIGMSIAANRVKGIRAALCFDALSAKLSREHNDSNILCLGGRIVGSKMAEEIVLKWLETPFLGGRHEERIKMIDAEAKQMKDLIDADKLIYDCIRSEKIRQMNQLEMIASENFASLAVMQAEGSVLMNKYAEGYPGKRYYAGCEYVDAIENIAIERLNMLFGSEYANVQPHSGSQANMAVYFSILNPGDKILTMDLAHGGHLTHGSPVNFSGRFYNVIHYGVKKETGYIDYEQVERLAKEHRPKLIVAGASSYPRTIDFAYFKQIADSVNAYFMVDMAHIAGLVATGIHPSPVPFADFVTSTTHKTLRGPRGGIILAKEKFAKILDSQIFPGIQGGPHMNIIAAKAVAFKEALSPEFKTYQQNIVANAKALAQTLLDEGFNLVSGGTDNHLILVDLTDKGITGAEAEEALEMAGITVNKNAIPFDTRPPRVTSGIRIGTPAVTTRGLGVEEMKKIGEYISRILKEPKNDSLIRKIRMKICEICEKYPIYDEKIH